MIVQPEWSLASKGMTKSSMMVSGRDRDVEFPADGVDRPVGSQQGSEPALTALQEGLVLPVEAVGIAARYEGRSGPAAPRRPHAGVPEPAHEPARPLADRCPCSRRTTRRSGSLDLVHGRVQHRGLAASLGEIEQPHALVREPPHDRSRSIAATVQPDHDLEAIARIIHRQRVADPLLDDGLLVVRRDQERDIRPYIGSHGVVIAADQTAVTDPRSAPDRPRS